MRQTQEVFHHLIGNRFNASTWSEALSGCLGRSRKNGQSRRVRHGTKGTAGIARTLLLGVHFVILWLLQKLQARSSMGERFLDAEEAGGSIPPVPTLESR